MSRRRYRIPTIEDFVPGFVFEELVTSYASLVIIDFGLDPKEDIRTEPTPFTRWVKREPWQNPCEPYHEKWPDGTE